MHSRVRIPATPSPLASATALATVALVVVMGLTGCSGQSGEASGDRSELSTTSEQMRSEPAASEPGSSDSEASDPTQATEALGAPINLTELEQGDRAMQVEACNTLLGSPLQIAEKLGLPVDYLEAVEADLSDSASAPWTEAATTANVSGQVDLSCNFQTDYQGTVYVIFGVPGEDGINSYCEYAELLCVATDDKQRMITLINHGAEPIDGTVDDAPFKELLDRFTA